MDRLMDRASPEDIAEAAVRHGCRSVAFTYNDPVIFMEYAMDVADACHERNIRTVAVSAGYMHEAARREFYSKIDAANIDLKAFAEDYYFKLTSSHLQPVLDTLCYIKHETDTWLEITTLLIPGKNDSDEELAALSEWVVRELGPDVPIHFSAFHPAHRMMDVPPTPPATLVRARDIAMQAGIHFAYTGNIHDRDGDTTFCTKCRSPVIERDWYEISRHSIAQGGYCSHCGSSIPGRFESTIEHFGRKRIPVKIGA
jgi:pyruvate formate lyase activating enzyme